jgi:hypothetical protein
MISTYAIRRPIILLQLTAVPFFAQSLHFSLLLQRPPVETMVHAAGLSIAAWVVLSDRYRVRTRPDEECHRLLHAYQLDGVHRGYIGGMLRRRKEPLQSPDPT